MQSCRLTRLNPLRAYGDASQSSRSKEKAKLSVIITVTDQINTEEKAKLSVIITVTDQINTEDGVGCVENCTYLSSVAYLSVNVVDEPDLAPQFLNEPYVGSVPENCPLGTPVLTVSAIDRDKGVNYALNYSLLNASVPFAIHLATGTVTVRSALDRERLPSEEVLLEVLVNASVPFAIHLATGTVTVRSALDRERLPSEEVLLEVLVQEEKLDIYGQVAQASATVTIQVTDVNDNTPQFYECELPACDFTASPQSSFRGSLEEHSSTRVPGSNGAFELQLQGPDAASFSISPSRLTGTGAVQVLVKDPSTVDYEQAHVMTVEIIANDTGNPGNCCSIAIVTIQLLDINDHSPRSISWLPVLENSPAGTVISSNITATDPDSADFGRITYKLLPETIWAPCRAQSSGLRFSPQDVNDNAPMFLNEPYVFSAVDGGGMTGSTYLEITLQDANDNAPVVSGSYNVFVNEGQENISVQIQAFDNDEPGTGNSHLRFQLEPGAFSANFTIDPATGVLRSLGALDREALGRALQGKVVVTVRVHDLGVPQLSSLVNVTITVEGKVVVTVRVHDLGVPQLSSLVNVTITVEVTGPQRAPGCAGRDEGTFVGSVEAEDADQTEVHHRISFQLGSSSSSFLLRSVRLGPGHYQGNLSLDPDVALDYDRLSPAHFNLTVRAENTGTGDALNVVLTTVYVQVLDVNDEPPALVPASPQDVSVAEDAQPGLLTTLQASDLDTNHSLHFQELGLACYKGAGSAGHVCQDWFYLAPNGSVFLNSSQIDYEVCDLVTVTLRVEDTRTEEGNPYSNNDGAPNGSVFLNSSQIDYEVCDLVTVTLRVEDTRTEEGNPYSNNATLRILISDVNDNSPEFLRINDTFVVVPEVSPVDLPVAVVKARDADTGSRGAITFTISRVVFLQDNGPNHILSSVFKLGWGERLTPCCPDRVASNLDGSLKGRYQVTVEAQDGGTQSLSSLAVLDIFTVDQSYRVRLVFSTSVNEVQDNSVKIKAALTVATRATVYVAVIQSAADAPQAQEKSVMEAYFVYSNGTALGVNELSILVQSNQQALSELIQLGLTIIGPGTVVEPSKEKELIGVIVGLAAGLMLLLLVMTLALLATSRSYRRKLKAMKALKMASTLTANVAQQGPAIPGTNKYNAEGANPVLNLTLDPPADLGFDEDSDADDASLNSLDENMVENPAEGSPGPPVLQLGRAGALTHLGSCEEPLTAALQAHRTNPASKPARPPGDPNRTFTFSNPCLDTTDL
ncbi:Cadherin-related family member 2 [Chelonia mydas]|uniref:Cadherin-related family member 2 n=1 Tax=Chelonia mydas TaxID=8469 RepID=M7BFT8_CHEMY|nr:Cadherin-related family member 2 [Chelonia mydas]